MNANIKSQNKEFEEEWGVGPAKKSKLAEEEINEDVDPKSPTVKKLGLGREREL